MLDTRLVVVSCPSRQPIQVIWRNCREANWTDCPLPLDMLSPEKDVGWNANLVAYLESIGESFVLLMLDDHFIEAGNNTANVLDAIGIMKNDASIGLIKLQAGNAWPPELPFERDARLGEYDREHHPFKRTNLVPTLFRRSFLLRLSQSVLIVAPNNDKGRNGALEFEVAGTLLTESSKEWPERMLGIHRPEDGSLGSNSFLTCLANDGIREGRFNLEPSVMQILNETANIYAIPGIRDFMPVRL